uniref:TGF-beta family profile domain-containing protein n=1 Tax=Glossina brevipalpis TaxID=37001 RepID=A0A1A9WAL4_9MUSC
MNLFISLSLILCVSDALQIQKFSEENLNKSLLELEMRELLGIGQNDKRLKRQLPLKNSAGQFLLEVYNIVEEYESENFAQSSLWLNNKRLKRSLRGSNLLTGLDVIEISKSNTIITFPSKPSKKTNHDPKLIFTINKVSNDLQLVHSVLRIYQQQNNNHFQQKTNKQLITLFLYQRDDTLNQSLKILSTTNTTTIYKGWLEFEITENLRNWLKQDAAHFHDLMMSIHIRTENATTNLSAQDLGLILPYTDEAKTNDFQPFIIAYFNGPELMQKIQKLRTKRYINKKKENHIVPSNWKSAMCKRHHFVIDFEELNMDESIIAPKQYEAYFCAGDCNFPLNMQTDATNHAIVQNLMHINDPSLPKPCCTPSTLSPIKILHYDYNGNGVLRKYANSIAKRCGCH